MREKTTIWISLAAFLVGAGLIVFAVVMTLNHWDFKKLDTTDFITETVKPEGSFKNIKISADSADIRLLPTESDACSVVFRVPEKYDFSATVDDDTLTIRAKDDRSWTDRIGLQLKSPEITVYLPDSRYEYLTAKSDSGEFTLPQDFTFTGIEIETESGDVSCSSSSDSYAKFTTDSGDVSLSDMTASNINVTTDSGEIDLKRCIAALSVDITTQSGDVTGHFLHEIACNATTKSGSVTVPCKITTKSGDVKITADAGTVPTPTEAVTTPDPTPTEAVTTPDPTPTAEPVSNIRHIVADPQSDSVQIALNQLALYPDDSIFRVIVRYTGEGENTDPTIGVLLFDNNLADEKYRLCKEKDFAVGEEAEYVYYLSDIMADKKTLGAMKLMIDIDSTTGFTLVGVDIILPEGSAN